MGESFDEFLDVMREEARSVDNITIAGDINTHFERINNFTTTLKMLIKENRLELVETGASYFRGGPPS